jgi:hypothetical protein
VARDLIPPPSPAGRPSADPEWHERPAPAPEPAPAAPTPASHGPSPFRSRFGFVLGALIGVLVCAGVAFALLVGSTPAGPGGAQLADHWSTWQPPTSDPGPGAAAIAEHVAGDYRMDDGKQLVLVDGGPLQLQSLPLTVALHAQDGSLHNYGSDGIVYTLHGLGKDGRIVGDKPSVARHTLLRREALELALYSFRYLDGITEVVALLPPAFPSKPTPKGKGKHRKTVQKVDTSAKPQLQALYYRPGDLRPQLESPLSQTLDPGRLRPRALRPAETRRIDALTMPNLFLASYQLAQNQLPYLVLDRPSS